MRPGWFAPVRPWSHRGTLIRSYTAGDLGFILHSRHQFQWHTGDQPPQTVACPHIGSFIARTLGPLNPAVPACINIGQRFDYGEAEEWKAFRQLKSVKSLPNVAQKHGQTFWKSTTSRRVRFSPPQRVNGQ